MSDDETARRLVRTLEQGDGSIPSTVVDCTGPSPPSSGKGAPSLQKLSSPIEIVHG